MFLIWFILTYLYIFGLQIIIWHLVNVIDRGGKK